MSETPTMTSIQRGFAVIHALWELRGAGPSEIARHLDLSKSTAHVYLRSLAETGYVVNHGGTYELSYHFLTMGSRLKFRNRLFQVSKAEMRELAAETGELIVVFVEQAGRAILLHQEGGSQALQLGTYPGQRLPMHSHASGKVLLAYMGEGTRERVLEERGLPAVTEETITDRSALRAELAEIREAGYAFDADQQVRGMGVVAVPIFVKGSAVGTLSAACPSGRLTDGEYRAELCARLQETADGISINYRYGT